MSLAGLLPALGAAGTLAGVALVLGARRWRQGERALRRGIEQALQGSVERYVSLLAVLDDGVVSQAPDGKILACNPSAVRMLGLVVDALTGRAAFAPGWTLLRADGTSLPAEEHPTAVALGTGVGSLRVTLGHRLADGDQRWLSVVARPVRRHDEERPSAVVTVFSDVTEQRQAQQALREQDAYFRQLSGERPSSRLRKDS